MDEQAFRKYMKANRRSESATNRCVSYVGVFAQFLADLNPQIELDAATEGDLEHFVAWSKVEQKNTKTLLWALTHYFSFISNQDLAREASKLRQNEIKRQPLPLKEIRKLHTSDLSKLAEIGITNVSELLNAAKTPTARRDLASNTNISEKSILEMAKLADLCRIPGVKGIRARLYFDAGVDTLEKMAEWDPLELREMLIDFVEKTGFDGIAPWLKEAQYSVRTASKLPKMLELQADG
jgi:hypothetical protein